MKKYIIALATLISLMVLGGMHVSAAPKELKDVQNYQIYYNNPTPEIIKHMKNYDMVIIEPHYYTQEMIAQIRAQGTAVYAYLNVMEADNWNHSISKNLQPKDYFYRNGEKIYFDKWDSYLVDITSSHYQNLLLKEVELEIAGKGFDGIFLDTVGNIDDQHSKYPADLRSQRQGLVTFLNLLDDKFGKLSLIQNWGFDTLKTTTHSYVDGIMWESFEAKKIKNDQWSQNRIQDLQALAASGLTVLTVSFTEPSYDYAWSKNFIHTFDADYFDTWTYNQTAFKKPTTRVASVNTTPKRQMYSLFDKFTTTKKKIEEFRRK